MKKRVLHRALVSAYAHVYMGAVALTRLYKSALYRCPAREFGKPGAQAGGNKNDTLPRLISRGESAKELLAPGWMSETV